MKVDLNKLQSNLTALLASKPEEVSDFLKNVLNEAYNQGIEDASEFCVSAAEEAEGLGEYDSDEVAEVCYDLSRGISGLLIED